MEGGEAGFHAVGLGVAADERDHLVGLALDGGFDGGFTGEEGLVGIGLGRDVGGGTLGDAGLGHADFHAGDILFDDLTEGIAGTAEFGVAESVGGGIGREVVAVGIDEALGDDDLTEFLSLEDAADVFENLLLVERNLGEEDDVGRIVRVILPLGEGGAGGDPAGGAAHDLDDGDEVALAHGFVVTSEFAHGGGEILDDRAVAGSVVGERKIVVDRLGHADDAELVALRSRELGNFVGRVLGIVAADVEKVADVVGLEDFEHAVEIGLFLELEAAGAEGGAGRVLESADLLLGLAGQIDKILLENAEDAVERAVNLLDALVVQRFGNDARDTGVNDGGGAAGLAHQDVSYEFSHDSVVLNLDRESTT